MDAGESGNTTLKVETNFHSPSPRRSFPVVGRIRLPMERDDKENGNVGCVYSLRGALERNEEG